MKASKIPRRPVEYIWKEHFPYGMMSIVAGAPGKGKSTLGLKVAADVSKEEPVIVSSYEEPVSESIVPKLEAAGADMDNVDIQKYRFPGGIKKLARYVESEGARLLIMDTASDHSPASIYHVRDIRSTFEPLVELCDQTDLAIIMISHTVKKIDIKADPLNAIGGSQGGLAAMVRCAYLFGYSPKDIDDRVMVQLKCNIDYDRPALKFAMDVHEFDDGMSAPFLIDLGKTSTTAVDVFQAQPKADPKKLENVAEWMIESLYNAGGKAKVKSMMDRGRELGYTSRMIRRVADQLEIEDTEGVWALPPVPLEANIEEGDERE
jgi:hypothetical protein